MTGVQHAKIQALSRCSFQTASFDKRFIRSLSIYPIEKELTEKQAQLLEQMFHRYRRQIKGHERICKVCSGEVPERKRPKYDKVSEDMDKLERWKKATQEIEQG